MDINCKDYNQHDCKSLNPNCEWAGKRKCIRRRGVLQGKRYRYISGGSVEEIEPQFEGLNFVYNPDFDRVVPDLPRKTLGSGTYGITFVPAMDCTNGQRYPKSLGKVFYSQKSADEEWAISQRLKKVEHRSQKYFSYPSERCEIDVPRGNTQPEQELREFILNKHNLPVLPQLVMEYSGMTLHEYFGMYYKPESVGRSEFIRIFENLFYAVKQLQKHKLVHQDIKSTNVVISNSKRLRLIDFGLTKYFNDFYDPDKNFLLTVPYHGVAPPENYMFQLYDFEGLDYNTIINWLPKNKDHHRYYVPLASVESSVTLFVSVLKNIVRGAVDKLKLSPRVTDVLKPDEIDPFFVNFIKNCLKIGEFSKRETRFSKRTLFDFKYFIENDLIKFWKENQFALKSDLYSIGSTMLSQINYLKRSADDDPVAVEQFKELMYGILNPIPMARMEISDALELVKELKNLTSEDPFRRNKDPSEVTDIFMQFGDQGLEQKLKTKSNGQSIASLRIKLATLNSEIKYLFK